MPATNTRTMMLRVIFAAAALLLAMPQAFGRERRPKMDADLYTVVQSVLSESILGESVPMDELKAHCRKKVPAIPNFTTSKEWEIYAERLRNNLLDKVVFRGLAKGWREAPLRIVYGETIPGGPGYRIKKLRYEAAPGMWIPALLYEPENLNGKVPAVLNPGGHLARGVAVNHKQLLCINCAKRGMLALNIEWIQTGQLRKNGFVHNRLNQLDLCGTSGLAPFFLNVQRGLDVLLSHPNADADRTAVAGFSGGGWQTIMLAGLDPRVKLANPVSGYSGFMHKILNPDAMGDAEQSPADLGLVADYTHLGALVAPRPMMLTYSRKEPGAAAYVIPRLIESAKPAYSLYKAEDRLESHVNRFPGTHNFERGNRQAFYYMLAKHFSQQGSRFPVGEIESHSELKSEKELAVPLPTDNADLHTLALAASAGLPREASTPRKTDEIPKWRDLREQELASIVRASKMDCEARAIKSLRKGDIGIVQWSLRVGGEWTVPATELEPARPCNTTILIADEGRAATAETAALLVEERRRVVAIDPLLMGESSLKMEDDYRFAIFISCLGDRPVGIQASQIAATVRWLCENRKLGPVTIHAIGPRSSLAALIAACLERKAIGGLILEGCLGSLHEILEQDLVFPAAPELFCFGLLEKFDISSLIELIAPCRVELINPGPSAIKRLTGVFDWYLSLGKDFASAFSMRSLPEGRASPIPPFAISSSGTEEIQDLLTDEESEAAEGKE